MLVFIISSIAIISSIVVISARNPLHSLLALIAVVLNVVFLLILLGAEFLALIFVAVYLGAVAVLFLFVVMMLNVKAIDFSKEMVHSLPIGSAFGGFFLYIIYSSHLKNVDSSKFSNIFYNHNFFDWKALMFDIKNIDLFGASLYTHYAPFLLMVGVVLLIAMLGGVMLTKTNYIQPNKKRNFIDQQVARNFENAVFLVNERRK